MTFFLSNNHQARVIHRRNMKLPSERVFQRVMDGVEDKEKRRARDTQWYDIVVHCNWIGWSAETMSSSERLEWCLIDGENIAKWVFKHEKLWIIKWATTEPLDGLSTTPPRSESLEDRWSSKIMEKSRKKIFNNQFRWQSRCLVTSKAFRLACSSNKPAMFA